MSRIDENIKKINNDGKKALSVFLTAGFPEINHTVELASLIFDTGADIIELGIPFSDPLADGPVIQKASLKALENNVDMEFVFRSAREIKNKYPEKIVILMGYANPVMSYGIERFAESCRINEVDGVIIPDVPLDEYESFFGSNFNGIDTILLTTPVTGSERVKEIDNQSSGFVYCVSIMGTTGVRNSFDEKSMERISATKNQLVKNKMMIGFGISGADSVKKFAPHCDGVIVGSAVIKTIEEDYNNSDLNWSKTKSLLQELVNAVNTNG